MDNIGNILCSLLVLILPVIHCEDIKEYGCFKTQSGISNEATINISCPIGQRIQVLEAVYVKNRWDECIYSTGDCVEKTNTSIECCGKNNCIVRASRNYSAICAGFRSFLRIVYKCVPDDGANLLCLKDVTYISNNKITTKKTDSSSTSPNLSPNSVQGDVILTTKAPMVRPKYVPRYPVDGSKTAEDPDLLIWVSVAASSVVVVLCIILAAVCVCKRRNKLDCPEQNIMKNGNKPDLQKRHLPEGESRAYENPGYRDNGTDTNTALSMTDETNGHLVNGNGLNHSNGNISEISVTSMPSHPPPPPPGTQHDGESVNNNIIRDIPNDLKLGQKDSNLKSFPKIRDTKENMLQHSENAMTQDKPSKKSTMPNGK